MKIYVIAYTRKNLGDDLFLTMLVSKYSYINFDINVEKIEYAKSLKKFNNVNIIVQKNKLKTIDITKYDAIVYIAGSIFMEQHKGKLKMFLYNKFIKHAQKKNIPFYYISSNFGPYKTKRYFKMAKNTFKNCEDICFRDKYSYQLFKELDNVRYAPDLIFSYNIEKTEIKKDTIGISIIDLNSRKDLKNKEKQYLEMLKNNIENYQKQGKKVYLFSFCDYQGDESAIEKIRNMIKNKESLTVVNYDGDIEEFLKIYSKMECMICTRFHSMVLSAKLGQKVFVVSYSDKMDNVIKDLDLPFNSISIKDIKEDTILNLEELKKVEQKELEDKTADAKKQLEKLDEFIVERSTLRDEFI